MQAYYIDPHYKPAQDKEALKRLEDLRFEGGEENFASVLNLARERHAESHYDSVAFILSEATLHMTGQKDRLDQIAKTAYELAEGHGDGCGRGMPHAYTVRLYTLAHRHLEQNPDHASGAAHFAFTLASQIVNRDGPSGFTHATGLFSLALTHAAPASHHFMIDAVMGFAQKMEKATEHNIETLLPVVESVLNLCERGSSHETQALSYLKAAVTSQQEAERPNPALAARICKLALNFSSAESDKKFFKEKAFSIAERSLGLGLVSCVAIRELYQLSKDPHRRTEHNALADRGIATCSQKMGRNALQAA